MQNIRDIEFNRNVVQVYTEEPGYTGYKGFDFTKIDNIEDLLKSGVNVNVTGANQLTINGNVTVSNEVEVKNEQNNPIPIQGSVSVSNFPAFPTIQNVNVQNSSLPVVNSNITSLKETLNNVIFSEGSSPSGVIVYQTNLNKDLDNVSVYISGSLPSISGTVTSITEKSSNISNYAVQNYNDTVLNPNAQRKELYIQNLGIKPLYVKYGTEANANSFNFVLSANTTLNAGDGGSLSDQNYVGHVSVSGENPRYISWERS